MRGFKPRAAVIRPVVPYFGLNRSCAAAMGNSVVLERSEAIQRTRMRGACGFDQDVAGFPTYFSCLRAVGVVDGRVYSRLFFHRCYALLVAGQGERSDFVQRILFVLRAALAMHEIVSGYPHRPDRLRGHGLPVV